MVGVTVHAHIVSQLLRCALHGNALVSTLSERQEWLWLLLWSVLGGALGEKSRSPWSRTVLVTGGLLVLGVTAYGALLWGWWIPLVPPVLAWLLAAVLVSATRTHAEEKYQENSL